MSHGVGGGGCLRNDVILGVCLEMPNLQLFRLYNKFSFLICFIVDNRSINSLTIIYLNTCNTLSFIN